jgi:hypothetical protein
MKDRILKILIWLAIGGGLYIYCFNLMANEMHITQSLYDQAIYEIEQGNRNKGCRTLHEAFAHSMNINDDWKTYNHIWNIGTVACNWTMRPDTVETSN